MHFATDGVKKVVRKKREDRVGGGIGQGQPEVPHVPVLKKEIWGKHV